MFRRILRRKRSSTDFSAEIQAHIQLEEERDGKKYCRPRWDVL